jgi:hypothetical protein
MRINTFSDFLLSDPDAQSNQRVVFRKREALSNPTICPTPTSS